MKKLSYCCCLILVALFFTVNCEKATHGSEKTKPQKSLLVYIGVDGSGSYNYLDNAKERMKKVIDYLPDGAQVNIRWITENSYLPKNAIESLTLPRIRTKHNENMFKMDAKLAQLKFKKETEQLKNQFLMKILQAPFPNSRHTDILGFLLLCSERINNYRKECTKYIIMFTDLKNNVQKYRKYLDDSSLKDTHIFILSYEHTDHELKQKWERNLQQWGAFPGYYYGPDEDFPNFFKEGL